MIIPRHKKSSERIKRSHLQCMWLCSMVQMVLSDRNHLFSLSLSWSGLIDNNRAENSHRSILWNPQTKRSILHHIFSRLCTIRNSRGIGFGSKSLPTITHRSNDVFVCIFNMFIKCNDMESAESFFSRLKRSVLSYGSLMTMYNVNIINPSSACRPRTLNDVWMKIQCYDMK